MQYRHFCADSIMASFAGPIAMVRLIFLGWQQYQYPFMRKKWTHRSNYASTGPMTELVRQAGSIAFEGWPRQN